MGVEKMPVKTRQIRSAGSRKVAVPARASSSTDKANKKGINKEIIWFLLNTGKCLQIWIYDDNKNLKFWTCSWSEVLDLLLKWEQENWKKKKNKKV